MFSWADYLVCAATLLLSLVIGLYYALSGGRQDTTSEYLVANRQMKILPVSLSMSVSYLSSIAILGNPSEFHYYGPAFVFFIVGLMVGVLIAIPLAVPLFYPLRITSINEYLTYRFESRVVLLFGWLCQTIKQLIYGAIVTYGASVMFEAMCGFPPWATMTLMGITCSVYSAIGGLKAVIWTDAFQTVIIFAGLITVMTLGTIKAGGIETVWSRYEGHRLSEGLKYTPLSRQCAWGMFLYAVFEAYTNYASSQSGVQRIAALKSMRDAKLAVLLTMPVRIALEGLAALCGVVTFSYYSVKGCDPMGAGNIQSPNGILPYFVMEVMKYPGAPGLFAASVFSGALSTVSSCINSSTAILWDDLLLRRLQHWPQARQARLTKLVAFGYGLGVLCLASLLHTVGGTMNQISLLVSAIVFCPTTIFFLVGALVPRVNWKSLMVGSVVSMFLAGAWSVGSSVFKSHTEYLPYSVANCTSVDVYLNTSIKIHGENYDLLDLGETSSTQSPSQTTLEPGVFSLSPFLTPVLVIALGMVLSILSSYVPGFYTTERKPHLYFTFIRRMTFHDRDQIGCAEYKLTATGQKEPSLQLE